MLNSTTTDTARAGTGRQADTSEPVGGADLLRQFRTGIPVGELSRLADQTTVNTAVTVFMSLMAAGFIVLDSRQMAALAWMLIQIGLSLLVSWRARRALRRGRSFVDDARLSRAGLYRAVGWAAFSGTLWGALTFFIPASSAEARIVILLAIGGMAAGASTTLAAVPQAAIAYVVACALPLVTYFFSQASSLGTVVAIATMVFGAAMVATTRIVHLSLRRQLDAEQRSEHFRATVLQHRIDSVVNPERPLDDSLTDSVREICLHTGWETGFAFLPARGRPAGKSQWKLRRRCTFGAAQRLDTPGARSASRRLVSIVGKRQKPAWVDITLQDGATPRPPATLLSHQPGAELSGAAGEGIMVGMPVIARGEIRAIAAFCTGNSQPPGPSIEELLDTIGVHLGNTFERHAVVRKLRATELRARREEARAREYLDIAGAIVVAIDRNERVTLINRACARTLECSEGDAIGQNWFDRFVQPTEREARRTAFRQWMNAEAPVPAQLEAQLLSTTGRLHLVRAQMTLLREDDGNICGLLSSAQDITAQRNTEAQLLQAQKMEAVGQLASGIAHDFNNLLMAARGNLELLQETSRLSADAASLVGSSTAALDSAAALTTRLLSFSRKGVLLTRPTRLDAVVNAIMEIVSRTFGPTIAIDIDVDSALWMADADPTQVEASVLNLAINARDAMPEGGMLGVRLTNARLGQREASELGLTAGDYVTIVIEDTGTGMPAAVVQRAFEPFFSTKAGNAGSGLGLSTVYGFAKQSGGTATLDSTPDKGTTATIYLPRSGSAERPVGGDAHPVDSGRSAENARILVVDDEAPTRDVTCLMLSQQGFRVSQAPGADEALAMLNNDNAFDLVLTDIRLGSGPDGYALATRLRDEHVQTRVLFMSGFADSAPAQHGWSANSLLRKPFSMEQLAASVRDALA